MALGLLVVGVVLVLAGFANVSGSHEDPSTVTCDNAAMKPGDTCVTYSNSSPVRTRTYEEVRADHVASIERGRTQGPLFLVLGSLVVGGALLTVLVASTRPRQN